MALIEIQNVHATADGEPILNGIDLRIEAGEVHAIMGPNGSGKSTLASVIAGRDEYDVEKGEVLFEGEDLTELEPEERAAQGVFMAFQYPVEIPGVSNVNFLKAAVNGIRKQRGEKELDAMDFLAMIRERASMVKMDQSFLSRSVNEGFSGGEKKRNEILQLLALKPTLAVLDETDSGLDIDALQVVSAGVNRFLSSDRGVLLVTHYQRLLDHIRPHRVHVLADGQIVRSGDASLALQLEEKGYAWLTP